MPETVPCQAMNHLRHGPTIRTNQSQDVPGAPDEWKFFSNRMTYWGTYYDELCSKKADMSVYERLAREHLNRQPTIVEDLVDALKANVCRSYRALSKVINEWCSPKTIEKRLKAYPEYHIYSKNIKPGLTSKSRVKQVAFSNHVHNRWLCSQSLGITGWHQDFMAAL